MVEYSTRTVTSPSIRFASSKLVSAALVPLSAFSITIALNAATLQNSTSRVGRIVLKTCARGASPECGTSGRRDCGSGDRLFHDGQVDDCRQNTEQHRKPPHKIVRAGALECYAADQHAEKTSDLMAEKRKAE